MRKTPEIMAPVGGEQQLLAAVRCGADAVYLGGKLFNARRNAANFGGTDLGEAVRFCHGRGVKVYVTVNTLVTDAEMGALEAEADGIAAAGADAVIIQDLAVLKYFAGAYPSLRRFASTQTAVHNVDGARFLQDAGFDSIVLARELTLDEIERITSRVPLTAEAFVHGAHCMSVSGACYLSAMFGGRSGNRGLCAQPCRLGWRCGGKDYCLSLKDMSLLGHVREMADAGVDLLKIEGRMKRPEYVAAAVTACRQAIAGEPYDRERLRAVFSRSGFTDGYLTGKRDASMYGVRTKDDAADAGGVLGELARLYDGERPLVPVRMRFSLDGERSLLTVTDGTRSVSKEGPAGEKALTRPLDAGAAERSLAKTGGTPFFVTESEARIGEGLTIRSAELNALRRAALEELLSLRSETPPHRKETIPARPAPVPYRSGKGRPALWARYASADRIGGAEGMERILLPLERVTEELIERFGERLTAQLPTLLFPEDEEGLREVLRRRAREGLRSVWTNNIYGITLGRDLGLTVHGGFGLNVLNTDALGLYERAGLASLTLSFEGSMPALRAMGGGIPRGIAAYGRLPLMHFRNCPVRAAEGCAKCLGRGELTDRKGIAFPVECHERRWSMLLNSVPLDIAGRVPAGFDYALLYFTRETAAEAARVAERFAGGEKAAGPHTAGLYFRELL